MQGPFTPAALGALAGLLAAAMWVGAGSPPALTIVMCVASGTLLGYLLPRKPESVVEPFMTGGALGVGVWCVIDVLLGRGPAAALDPAALGGIPSGLLRWVLFGAVHGAIYSGLTSLLPDTAPSARTPAPFTSRRRSVVILGGGFAGLTTARELEKRLQFDPTVRITLVSETNALLFTPMLAEVAGSSVEPTHISSPLRTALRRTDVIRARVTAVDFDSRRVSVAALADSAHSDAPLTDDIEFDHLVFALGGVSNYLGLEGVKQNAFDFKSLLDAIRIRNHVIDAFERADREHEPTVRQSLLTFVVAGGGFAGTELAGSLNDFARGMMADYPRLNPEELRVILVHSRDRILPELSEPLGAYARDRMAERGVTFELTARVADAGPGWVRLSPEKLILTDTLIWTAGTMPNPLLQTLPVERDRRGAVVVDAALRVPGHTNVWALGDCAAVIDAVSGKPCPPTAQFALREGRTAAANIHAVLAGREPQPFHFESLGALCVVGHQTACAELTVPFARQRTVRFSGLIAWMMWRAIYLGKLPGMERKVRVLSDWAIELFFPRDIVQTIDLHERQHRMPRVSEAVPVSTSGGTP